MAKMSSAIPGPRVDRPKAGFLFCASLAALAYTGLLYTLPHPWRTAGILAPMALALALAITRTWRKHYEYRIAQFKAQPIGTTGHNVRGQKFSGAGEPVVRPVFVNDARSAGRHVLR